MDRCYPAPNAVASGVNSRFHWGTTQSTAHWRFTSRLGPQGTRENHARRDRAKRFVSVDN